MDEYGTGSARDPASREETLRETLLTVNFLYHRLRLEKKTERMALF